MKREAIVPSMESFGAYREYYAKFKQERKNLNSEILNNKAEFAKHNKTTYTADEVFGRIRALLADMRADYEK